MVWHLALVIIVRLSLSAFLRLKLNSWPSSLRWAHTRAEVIVRAFEQLVVCELRVACVLGVVISKCFRVELRRVLFVLRLAEVRVVFADRAAASVLLVVNHRLSVAAHIASAVSTLPVHVDLVHELHVLEKLLLLLGRHVLSKLQV